jgi:hypothetical protein
MSDNIETNEVNAAAEDQAMEAGLSIQDIGACVQVIDICSKRGSFEGPELETVGALRGRLVAFIKANMPEEEAAAAEEEAPAAEETAA